MSSACEAEAEISISICSRWPDPWVTSPTRVDATGIDDKLATPPRWDPLADRLQSGLNCRACAGAVEPA